mmetsp:Transcript_99426/g.186795  ORF Transcript_99426/g.186795 Transcript_99426/m.186795 type:complete len:290 (+) Transcript_99426:91-960(+)
MSKQSLFAGLMLVLGSHVVLAINVVSAVSDMQAANTAPLARQGGAGPPGKPAASWKAILTVSNLNDGSTGKVIIQVNPNWSPLGAQRFRQLVEAKFYDDSRFFRVISGFMAQFGIARDPAVTSKWTSKVLKDDPDRKVQNKRGRVTFATAGKDTRSTQIFINFADNGYLDSQGFTPFGEVISGLDVVDKLYGGYGEGAPLGKGPSQSMTEAQGNKYLDSSFPKLSGIQTIRVLAPVSQWGHTRRVISIVLGLFVFLTIGTVGLHHAGVLEKLHAKLKARMASIRATHEP